MMVPRGGSTEALTIANHPREPSELCKVLPGEKVGLSRGLGWKSTFRGVSQELNRRI